MFLRIRWFQWIFRGLGVASSCFLWGYPNGHFGFPGFPNLKDQIAADHYQSIIRFTSHSSSCFSAVCSAPRCHKSYETEFCHFYFRSYDSYGTSDQPSPSFSCEKGAWHPRKIIMQIGDIIWYNYGEAPVCRHERILGAQI